MSCLKFVKPVHKHASPILLFRNVSTPALSLVVCCNFFIVSSLSYCDIVSHTIFLSDNNTEKSAIIRKFIESLTETLSLSVCVCFIIAGDNYRNPPRGTLIDTILTRNTNNTNVAPYDEFYLVTTENRMGELSSVPNTNRKATQSFGFVVLCYVVLCCVVLCCVVLFE